MSQSATVSRPAKIVGILSILAGLIMIVAGAVTWAVCTSQLKDERITVPADADKVLGISVAGKQVQGPITAFGQAQIIKKHASHSAGGKTYAELGADVNAARAKLEAAKTDSEREAAQAEVDRFSGMRTSVMNGAFLRSSLFSSVITYGVAALVMGLGLMFALLGWALMSLARAARAAVGHDDERAAGRAATHRDADDRPVGERDARDRSVTEADRRAAERTAREPGSSAVDET